MAEAEGPSVKDRIPWREQRHFLNRNEPSAYTPVFYWEWEMTLWSNLFYSLNTLINN